MEKEYWGKKFYESRLNTVLLLVLIILMVFALRFMYYNEKLFVNNNYPTVQNLASEEYLIRGTVTEVGNACTYDGLCFIEIDNLYQINTNYGRSICPNEGRICSEYGNEEGNIRTVGNKIEAYVHIENASKPNVYTIYGSNNYYIKEIK